LVAHTGVECFNEDINRNAVNEAGDDINRNNSLEPRKSDVAVSILGNGKTDDSGAATVRIEYPQNVASWLRVKILIAAPGCRARRVVPRGQKFCRCPIDAISAAASPAFIFSPYGTAISNADVTYPDGTFAANVSPCQNPN
jgi:hypothetical protein